MTRVYGRCATRKPIECTPVFLLLSMVFASLFVHLHSYYISYAQNNDKFFYSHSLSNATSDHLFCLHFMAPEICLSIALIKDHTVRKRFYCCLLANPPTTTKVTIFNDKYQNVHACSVCTLFVYYCYDFARRCWTHASNSTRRNSNKHTFCVHCTELVSPSTYKEEKKKKKRKKSDHLRTSRQLPSVERTKKVRRKNTKKKLGTDFSFCEFFYAHFNYLCAYAFWRANACVALATAN